MATKGREPIIKEKPGKLSFVMFQLEGSDETLQQGFKAIEQAFDKFGHAPRMTLAGKEPARALLVSAKHAEANGDSNLEAQDIESESETEELDSSVERPKKERKPAQYKTVQGLEVNTGPNPLDQFMTQRGNPSETSKKYLIIGAWLKLHREKSEITAELLFTCLRAMSWRPQNDILQPYRKMKSSGSGWVEASEHGTYSMTDLGMAAVEKMTSNSATEPE